MPRRDFTLLISPTVALEMVVQTLDPSDPSDPSGVRQQRSGPAQLPAAPRLANRRLRIHALHARPRVRRRCLSQFSVDSLIWSEAFVLCAGVATGAVLCVSRPNDTRPCYTAVHTLGQGELLPVRDAFKILVDGNACGHDLLISGKLIQRGVIAVPRTNILLKAAINWGIYGCLSQFCLGVVLPQK